MTGGELPAMIMVDAISRLEPFACLPNHVVGKGVIKELRRRHPESNIVAIDFDRIIFLNIRNIQDLRYGTENRCRKSSSAAASSLNRQYPPAPEQIPRNLSYSLPPHTPDRPALFLSGQRHPKIQADLHHDSVWKHCRKRWSCMRKSRQSG